MLKTIKGFRDTSEAETIAGNIKMRVNGAELFPARQNLHTPSAPAPSR
jgi:hypothetical protein